MSTMPQPGPLRDAYIAGATAEASHRDAPRKAVPGKVAEVADYIDSVIEHWQPATPGELIVNTVRVFVSTLTRDDRRAIRRALRGGTR